MNLDADVIVVGGSLGGISAANWLASIGRSAIVLERSATPLVGRGAGIVLHPSSARYLCEHGARLDDFSIATDALRYLGTDGEVIAERPAHLRYVSYAALHRRLVAAFDSEAYRLNAHVVDFAEEGDTVVVRTSNGTEVRAGMLVCADGIRSESRRRLLPGSALEYAGYVAWRGTVPYEALSEALVDRLSGAIAYAVLDHSHVVTYPIGGRDGEPLLCNWLWYRNVTAAELPELLTDRAGVTQQLSVQPGSLSGDAVEALHVAATRELAPFLADLVTATDAPFLQAIFECTVERMAFGRICLLGDAAFVARPHAAAGTAKACAEAAGLATALGVTADVPAALASWEAAQLDVGRHLVARARRAGDRMQFAGTWQPGEPLPFGLFAEGDSAFPTGSASTITI